MASHTNSTFPPQLPEGVQPCTQNQFFVLRAERETVVSIKRYTVFANSPEEALYKADQGQAKYHSTIQQKVLSSYKASFHSPEFKTEEMGG